MSRRRKFWMTTVAVTAVIAALAAVYRPVVVDGWSMWPTLRNRQVILMDRLATNSLRRGDIVVFEHEGDTYIKRVHAVGGEVLEYAHFRSGASHLIVPWDQMSGKIRRYAEQYPWDISIHKYRVPVGHVFVLGDNVHESMDSREFGPVPLDEIQGTVVTPSEAVRRFPEHVVALVPRAHARERPYR